MNLYKEKTDEYSMLLDRNVVVNNSIDSVPSRGRAAS